MTYHKKLQDLYNDNGLLLPLLAMEVHISVFECVVGKKRRSDGKSVLTKAGLCIFICHAIPHKLVRTLRNGIFALK